MEKLELWADRENRKVDPKLYSDKAESFARLFSSDGDSNRKHNKPTQIRKFYDEVVRLNLEARQGDWDNIHPLVSMLSAKAAYARGRDLVSDSFLEFVRGAVSQIETPQDLSVFSNLFEAIYGFYKLYKPSN